MSSPNSTLKVLNNSGSDVFISGQLIANGDGYTYSGQTAVVSACQDFVFRVCLLAGTIGIELNGQPISETVAQSSPVFSQLMDDLISGAVTAVG